MENVEYIKWLIGRNIYFTACPDHTLSRKDYFLVFVGMQRNNIVFVIRFNNSCEHTMLHTYIFDGE